VTNYGFDISNVDQGMNMHRDPNDIKLQHAIQQIVPYGYQEAAAMQA